MQKRKSRSKPKLKVPLMKEITIPRQVIVDQMAAYLYAVSVIDDDVDITNIQFSDLFGSGITEYCRLKVFTDKEVN